VEGAGVGTFYARSPLHGPSTLARCHTPPGTKPGPFRGTAAKLSSAAAHRNAGAISAGEKQHELYGEIGCVL